MGCHSCFTDYLAKCDTEILVYAKVLPTAAYESYRWVITDKFDRKYEGDFTTDGEGFWSIPVDELPDGLLTEFSGDFVLEVFGTDCKPVKFTMASEYDCIQFTVRGGTFEKNNLGCEF